MGEIKVTASQLRSKADELTQINATFRSRVESLVEAEMMLMGMWDGEAKTAFHNAFERDKENMSRFYNAIAQFICTLQQIAAKYDNADAQSAQIATTGGLGISGLLAHSHVLIDGVSGVLPHAMTKYAGPGVSITNPDNFISHLDSHLDGGVGSILK